jgi:hypothetical protein
MEITITWELVQESRSLITSGKKYSECCPVSLAIQKQHNIKASVGSNFFVLDMYKHLSEKRVILPIIRK